MCISPISLLWVFFSGGCIYRPCRWISSTTKTHYVPLKEGACSWIFNNSQRWHTDLLMCLTLPAVSKWSAKIIEQQLEEVMEPTGSLQSKCYPNSVIEELVGWGLNRAQFKLIYFHLTPGRAACPYCYQSWCANIFAKYRTSTWFSGTGLGFNRSPDTTHTQRTVLRGSAPPRSAGVWRRSSPLFQGYLLQEPHFPDPMGILITAVFLWAAVGGKHSSHPLNTHTVCMQGAFSVKWRQKIGKLSRRRPSSLHATTSATLFTAMEPALW